MHALEKLWKAAYVFHAEGSLEADLWGPGPNSTDSVRRGGPGRQGHPSEYYQAPHHRPQTQNAERGSQLPLPQPHPHALPRIPCQGMADRQWPGRRRLQESDQRSHGALRNALDRADGPRPSSNSEPFISQATLIATGNSTSHRISGGYTPLSGASFQNSHTQRTKRWGMRRRPYLSSLLNER